MKALKITSLIALFIALSSQTYNAPAVEKTAQEAAKIEKAAQTEFDLLAHIVTGIRIPTQG